MFGYLQVFCSLLSSLLLALAIPNELFNLGNPIIGIFALVPLYIVATTLKSYKRTFAIFFIHGITLHLLSSFWLGNFEDFAAFTLGASAIGTGVYEGLLSFLIIIPFRYYNKSLLLKEDSGTQNFSLPLRVFWFAGTYTIWEYTKSTGFLAYPWGTVSMTAFNWPLITQSAAIAGPYAVTFLFALFSSLCAEGILLFKRTTTPSLTRHSLFNWLQTFKFVAILFSVTLIYGFIQYTQTRLPTKKLNTVIVQANLDPWDKDVNKAITISQKITEKQINIFEQENKKADLVVWSEGVLNKRFPDAVNHYRYFPYSESLLDFIQRMDTPFVIGGPTTIDKEKRKYGNSANLFSRHATYSGSYTKMHLVPFAELIPLIDYEIVSNFVKEHLGFSRGWTPGDKFVLFEIPIPKENVLDNKNYKIYSLCDNMIFEKQPSVKISTPICFDDAFGEVCRGLFLTGCEVFVNITNDSWSLKKSAEYQHFVVAHYRSIEYRIPTVRTTNGGVSCVIDPAGKILKSLPLFEECGLSVTVPIYKRQFTTYAKFGNWFTQLLIALCIIFIIYLRKKEIQHNKQGISTFAIYYTFEQKDFIDTNPLDFNEWNW